MNVLVVADPLGGLAADIDASVGLMAAAQDLGASPLFTYAAGLALGITAVVAM